jgi:hypothetical protein
LRLIQFRHPRLTGDEQDADDGHRGPWTTNWLGLSPLI